MAHALIDEHHGLYEGDDLADTVLTYRNEAVAFHGPKREFVWPGRRVIDIPGHSWPVARPEDCTDDSPGLWFDAAGRPVPDVPAPAAPEGIALLCRSCGLDCT